MITLPNYHFTRYSAINAIHDELTSKTQGGHPLEFRLFQPLVHSPESFSPRFEFGPRLGVPQQVRQSPLRPAQDSLGEHRLKRVGTH